MPRCRRCCAGLPLPAESVPAEFAAYITQYGYVAIFLLVLLQELGVPNPVTNEFVLLFAGYLTHTGVLNLWLALAAAVSADCLGTTILYALSYAFGKRFIESQWRWVPVTPARIERIAAVLSGRRIWALYAGRHIPFLRGYVSVAAGLLSIRPVVFIPTVLMSAVTWSGGYVVAGRLAGPYWEHVAHTIGGAQSIALVIAVLLIAGFATRRIWRTWTQDGKGTTTR